MSEHDNQDSGDSIANVKGEFNRKLSNYEAKLSSLEQTNAALLDAVTKMTAAAPRAAEPAKALDTVWYNDPAAASEAVIQQAEKRIMTTIESNSQKLRKEQATLATLQDEFPELRYNDSPLTKRAVEIYNALPADEKTSPASYKLAVREAAMELDFKPRSKRPDSEDDFSMGSSYSGRNGSKANRKPALDKTTEEFARLMGVDLNNPKRKASLIEASKRTYKKWSQ